VSKQVQFRRGTTTEHNTFAGAVGEITVDTTKNTLVVHDGSTTGGFPVATAAFPTFTGNMALTSGGSYIQFADGTRQYSAALQNFYFIMPGLLYVPITGRSQYYATANILITTVYANVGTASTSGAIQIDILVNNVVINSSLTIPQGSFTASPVTLNYAVSSGQSVGIAVNTGNGSDLTVKFAYY
jgi:hypothetical protein